MTTYAPGTTPTPPPTLYFYDEASGVLTDPVSVQLDITYGNTLAAGQPDYAGPFTYSGASSPMPGQVYRISQGVYAYAWSIPTTAQPGVYVMNWTVGYGPGDDMFLAYENFVVAGSGLTPPMSGDIGYWTGSVTYGSVVLPLGAQDANGTAWMLKRVEGMDGAPTAGQVIQHAGDHGGFATPRSEEHV